MSEIQRYDICQDEGPIPCAEGEMVYFDDHDKRVRELEDMLRRTVKVIENLYPDQFCGDVSAEHEEEMKAVHNVLVKVRAALRK